VKQDYIEAPRPRRGKGDRWPLRLAGMAAAALLLVALAWFLLPAPLVNNAAQTELLSIQVVGAGRKTQCWKPQSMVDRQTARAIVDRMAHLHKQYTLQTASRPSPSFSGRRSITKWWPSTGRGANGRASPVPRTSPIP